MAIPNYGVVRDLVKGQKKILFMYGRPVAYLKEHSMDTKTDTVDIASKFSGDFDDKLGGKTSFSITCDAFVSDTADHLSENYLRHLQYTGESHPFEICRASVTEANGLKTIVKGDAIYKGRVIITSVGTKSTHGEYETVSISLEGSGQLTDGINNPFGHPTFVTRAKTIPS